MAGGFLLTEYAPIIEKYFRVDKEVVCFRTKQELVDRVHYYLEHDEERRAIARAGWEKATGQYTPSQSMRLAFNSIEADYPVQVQGRLRYIKTPGLPYGIRKRVSRYYSKWGTAYLLENYKGFWKDAFNLSLRYDPLNFQTWGYLLVGSLPLFMRKLVIDLYKSFSGKGQYHNVS